jgi:hypothetical protein
MKQFFLFFILFRKKENVPDNQYFSEYINNSLCTNYPLDPQNEGWD